GGEDAPVFRERRVLTELFLLGQQGDADGEFARHQHMVDVGGGARAAIASDARFDGPEVPELGRLQPSVDDAGGAALAKKDGVGAPLKLDALDVVRVPRDV